MSIFYFLPFFFFSFLLLWAGGVCVRARVLTDWRVRLRIVKFLIVNVDAWAIMRWVSGFFFFFVDKSDYFCCGFGFFFVIIGCGYWVKKRSELQYLLVFICTFVIYENGYKVRLLAFCMLRWRVGSSWLKRLKKKKHCESVLAIEMEFVSGY